ncbi:MAG: zinc-dependent alcohol dehydrogenase family protein [Chloroflexota bacterium]|jgi:propanol-preferring alcohol dehydrogenase
MFAMQLSRPAPVEDLPLQPVDLPVPRPSAGQVLLRVTACGVCRTDLHICEGDLTAPRLPLVPGHQAVGVVELTGAGVERVQVGQRVGAAWLASACGACPACRRGEENLCPQARFTGLHAHGGFAEWMLAEADFLYTLPGEISDRQAAPLLCAGIIGYRALRKAGVQPGERLGLFGFGASAHLAIQIARYWECEVCVFTRAAAHRRHAESLGAAWSGSPDEPPPVPLDCAVLFAPAGEIIPLALNALRPGGRLAVNALHASPIPAMPYQTLYGERSLTSVANATRQDGADLLRLAVEIPLRADTSLYPLDEANEALLDLKHSRLNGEAVLEVAAGLG